MADERFLKNVPNWKASEDDYLLAFRQLSDGIWHEISGNLPTYEGMVLADYLSQMGVDVPDGCTFCRCRWGDIEWEFRQNGGLIRIFYKVIR